MTLSDELEMARLETRAKFPALEVAVQDCSVYINFAFSEAVVITPEFEAGATSRDATPRIGRFWYAEALQWDRTHGVSAEVEIGSDQSLAALLDTVDTWLRERIEEDRRLEQLLAARPED